METINSGIYQIRNIVNNKKYIGSAVNFMKRWRGHKNDLNKNIHSNPILQAAWNKYGESAFVFEIKEIVPKKNLSTVDFRNLLVHDREQYYLDIIKPEYNVCLQAGSHLGVVRSVETLKKMSIAHRGIRPTEESRKKMSLAKIGKKRKPFSEEHTRRIKENHKGMTGRRMSDETKKKLSLLNKGRLHSDETRQKIKDSWLLRKSRVA